MDAVEYLKAWTRMCYKHNPYCKECPIGKEVHRRSSSCRTFENDNPEEAVEIVENWAAEHPKKTRQSEFLKVFPSVYKTDGIIAILPCSLDIGFGSNNYCNTVSCYDCRKEYWLTEVE